MEENNRITNIKENIKEWVKNPLDKIREVANENSTKFLKTAIILLILWTISIFIVSFYDTIRYWGFARIFKNIVVVLKDILAPTIGILVSSILVMILNKNNKKSLLSIMITIVYTKVPLIVASLISLLTIINLSIITTIQSSVNYLCFIIDIILEYFALKNLFGEDDDKSFLNKYLLLKLIYIVVSIIIMLVGINIL